jgi:hypothetical protein
MRNQRNSAAPELELTVQDYEALNHLAESYRGSIIVADLDPIYRRFPKLDAARSESYISLSDGKYIFAQQRLRRQVPKAAWDVAHLLGHMFQWNMSGSQARRRGLKYYGSRARALAVRDFRAADPAQLNRVLQYEYEADLFAYSILLKIRGESPDGQFSQAITRRLARNLSFIMDYYLSAGWGRSQRIADHPLLGSVLHGLSHKFRVIELPDSVRFRFQSFEMFGVPVVYS